MGYHERWLEIYVLVIPLEKGAYLDFVYVANSMIELDRPSLFQTHLTSLRHTRSCTVHSGQCLPQRMCLRPDWRMLDYPLSGTRTIRGGRHSVLQLRNASLFLLMSSGRSSVLFLFRLDIGLDDLALWLTCLLPEHSRNTRPTGRTEWPI